MTEENDPTSERSPEAAPASAPPPPAEEEAAAEVAPPEEALDPLQVAQAEAQRYREQLLRTAADFDNFRKRSRKELDDAAFRARELLLRELLPVFDNLERAVAAADDVPEAQSVTEGIRMVQRQFLDTLAKLGIERVVALGQAFDPALMEAIQQLPTTDFPPGAVAAEVQAGYRQGDRLLRPALVVVAKAP